MKPKSAYPQGRIGPHFPTWNPYYRYLYATAVWSIGWYPWNALLLLPLFRLRTSGSQKRDAPRVFGPRGTSCALLIERAPDPETDDADAVAGCSTATISRADLVSKAGPGTTAEAMAAAIAGHPRRSIDRCTPVILV
jgi:hypothetical protein